MHTDTHRFLNGWHAGWRAWVLLIGIALLGASLAYFYGRFLFAPAAWAWLATDAWWKWPAFVAVYAGSGFLLWRFWRRVRKVFRDTPETSHQSRVTSR